MIIKRLLSLILSVVLLGSIVTPALAADIPFSDISTTAWYYNDVKNAYGLGLINGRTDTSFAPNGSLTYAEAVKLAACMHQKYTEGSVTLKTGNPWYSTYVDYAKNNNIISKTYSWTDNATRAGYVEIFAHALPDAALNPINTIKDNSIPDVSSDYPQAAEIYKLYRAGILVGSDSSGTFFPEKGIKRSEVAAILTRMMNSSARKALTLEAPTSAHSSNGDAIITGITLNKSSAYLEYGESLLLTATVTPSSANTKITWTSDEPNDIKVDNGKVTVISKGGASAIITAKTENGLSATCYVMVKSSDVTTQTNGSNIVYSKFPNILSFENVSKDTPLWHCSDISYPEFNIYHYYYAYLMSDLPKAEELAKKYARWLQQNGYFLIREEDDPIIEQSRGNDIIYELRDPSNMFTVSIKGTFSSYGSNRITPMVDVGIDYSSPNSQNPSIINPPLSKQVSPVKITNIRAKMDSVGGWTFTFDVENRSNKTIKYLTPYWYCLNSVGDIVRDSISLEDHFSGKLTGPIEPGKKLANISNHRPFYNYDFANSIQFIKMIVEYMDGSTETITPDAYTDYWDLD